MPDNLPSDAELEKLVDEATPGPWAWTYIGEKTNGFVVGTMCDADGNALSGFVETDDFVDEEIVHDPSPIAEIEAATCNYHDARLIALAPALARAYLAMKAAVPEDVAKVIADLQGALVYGKEQRTILLKPDAATQAARAIRTLEAQAREIGKLNQSRNEWRDRYHAVTRGADIVHGDDFDPVDAPKHGGNDG